MIQCIDNTYYLQGVSMDTEKNKDKLNCSVMIWLLGNP